MEVSSLRLESTQVQSEDLDLSKCNKIRREGGGEVEKGYWKNCWMHDM